MRTTTRFALRVALVVAMAQGGTARAQEPRSLPRRVWLEARPWTCVHVLPTFARHVELACDAMGGECEVATSEGVATERASLSCDAHAPWTLRIEGSEGGETLVVTLEGDREQRLRKAAMRIARARFEELPATPAPAREQAPASESPVQPSIPTTFHWPSPQELPPDVPEPKLVPNRGGIALSSFLGVTNGRYGAGAAGMRAALAFPLPHGFYWGPGFSYVVLGEEGKYWGVRDQDGEAYLAGATVGWGAPFDHRWAGFTLDVGGGVTASTQAWGPKAAATAYGRAAFTLQIPIKSSPIRPTFTVAGMNMMDQLGEPAQMAMLEAGVAWQAW
jgi:hypothetical protein